MAPCSTCSGYCSSLCKRTRLLSDNNQSLLTEIEAEVRALSKKDTGSSKKYQLWEQLSIIFVDIDQTYTRSIQPPGKRIHAIHRRKKSTGQYLAKTLFNLITYHELMVRNTRSATVI